INYIEMPRRSPFHKAKPAVTTTKAEETVDVSCDVCNLLHRTESCPLLNSGIRVEDASLPSKAVLTLPDSLQAKKLPDGNWEVIANSVIFKGAQFGPLDAPKSTRYNPKCPYLLKVFPSKNQPYFLDTTDESKCNWMILVPFTTNSEVSNCICYQLQDNIYFTAVKEVQAGESLVVGYSPGYTAKLNEVKFPESTALRVAQSKSPKTYGTASEIKQSGSLHKSPKSSKGSVDHDYSGSKVSTPATPVSARRSNRKRKAVGDDDFIFETISSRSSPKKEPSSFTQIVDNTVFDTMNSSILADEDTDQNTEDEITTNDIFESGETDVDFDPSNTSENSPSKKDKVRLKGSRMGAVLALEEWKCKFCGKLEFSIPDFAVHLIEHYKSVGAARTEKSRLQKLSWSDDVSQSSEEATTGDNGNFKFDHAEEKLNDVSNPVLLSHVFNHSGDLDSDKKETKNDVWSEPKYPYYCDICVNKKVFNRGEYLIRHLKNHTGEVACAACNQMFTKESYLEHECMYEDLTEKTYICSECQKSFTNEKKLHIHLELIHSKSFECHSCQKTFHKNDSYESHKCKRIKLVDKFSKSQQQDSTDETNPALQCEMCDLNFEKSIDLARHLKSHGNFTCTICNKVLSNRTYKTHHSICKAVSMFATGATDQLKCPTCFTPFETRDGFRYHVATHTHPAMCPMCNLRLTSTTFIKTHVCVKFPCDGCLDEFATLIALKKHIASVHGQIEFYCFECALPFVTQDGYAAHTGCGVNDVRPEKKKRIRKCQDEGLFVCEVCGATYTKWSSLKTHRYTHGPKRFICELCGKSFHRREMLADHEFVHQEAQFECQICQKKMKSKKSLDVHMQIHKGNKRFQCDQCDKAFCQKINLTTHKLIHLPPELKGFECPHCKKKFASKEYLGFHIEGHEKGRNEICEMCGRSFVKLHMLNQHKKTAHGNQRYSCEFCKIIVRQKHSLTRHLKKRHQDLHEQWAVKGYVQSRYSPGDPSVIRSSAKKKAKNNEEIQLLEPEEETMYVVSSQGDGLTDESCEIIIPKVELLTEVVDVDASCEVETEELTFSGENMIIPENSNMMILQVEEGGEIVLTLASSDSLQCAGTTVVEGMIVDDGGTLQLHDRDNSPSHLGDLNLQNRCFGNAANKMGEYSNAQLVDICLMLGMSESKAKETIKNQQLISLITKLVEETWRVTGKNTTIDKKIANLLYILASKIKPQTEKYIPIVIQYIVEGKIDTEVRITAALKYLLENIKEEKLNEAAFEKACGVGINVTAEDIESAVKDTIDKQKDEIVERRYRFNIGKIMADIRSIPDMVWADGSAVKNEVELQVKLLLGPKTEEDLKPVDTSKGKGAGKKAGKGDEKSKSDASDKSKAKGGKPGAGKDSVDESSEGIEAILKKLPFHKPGMNYTTDGYPSSKLALDLLERHVKRVNGRVQTRFPPEPNGILHIGHAKAININFGYAKVMGGTCNLRYDDTNPEKEEERFFKSIIEMVRWLGYEPSQILHASDYFDQLYEWAVVLINKGLAYVCHQAAEDLKGFNPPPSPFRNRSVRENYQLFQDMKNGKFSEGTATLRMKVTLEEGKQDPVAYRIRYTPHPRTGDKWCVYPTYDFTHCLCDSIEDITHSLCTKEFQNRRSSYYWLCEAVETYIPVQWEYGRLNMCYTVVSKRKIAKLIDDKIVNDWDDPRLFTLPALRRRGIPPEALNDFCVRMGVTGAQIMVDPHMLDACARDALNRSAPRTMVVMDPIRVVISNFPIDITGSSLIKNESGYGISIPDFVGSPIETTATVHEVAFDKIIYIDREDFQEKSIKGYKRFAADQTVGLRHAGVVLKCEKIIKDDAGDITELLVSCLPITQTEKPKGFIHWVSQPIKIRVNLYDRLFAHKNPEDKNEVPNGFLSDCKSNTLTEKEGLADKYLLKNNKPFTAYQFERLGYFAIDPDSSSTRLVFNRTVTLKEDLAKKGDSSTSG
ncbi:unnamed protein product, partial [Allacma fusca]